MTDSTTSEPKSKSLKELFLAALEVSPSERSAWLDGQCVGDAELRRQLGDMLAAHEAPHSLLDQTAMIGSAMVDQSAGGHSNSAKPGTQIGPYKLREQIGEGGFGVVYVAEQTEPVRRKVALKIIKPGMDTREVIARFEAERQALALMDHPNVAKVLDAGTTEQGRPFFVMELVRGVSITEFCDSQKLSPPDRLQLFTDVCRAVQHAHQKGIIHRDLKPSNVMITMHDDKPVVKVIDFGVAKALSQKLTEKTVYTAYNQMLGTPIYMSPEQAQLSGLDIDTRSDVYGLGVLLYELLTGTTPFDWRTFQQTSFDELRRIIREEDPDRPSARLSTLKLEQLSTICDQRKVDPRQLQQLFRGELDWVVMKALEKDRNRRYESANALARDVQRYLDGDAVEACPPSLRYRLSKFSGRYRRALVTATVVTVLLVSGLVATSWLAIRARRAEQVANLEREKAFASEQLALQRLEQTLAAEQAAQEQAARAESEAAIVQAVNRFLTDDLLAQADPKNEPDREIRLREVLDRAASMVGERFSDQPRIEAAIRHTLGTTYRSLGDYKKAEDHLQRAASLREQELGSDHRDTLSSAIELASTLNQLDRHREAEQLTSELVDRCRRVLGEADLLTLRCARLRANAILDQGRKEEAESVLRSLLVTMRRVHGEEHEQTLNTINSLAATILEQGRYEEVEAPLRQILEIQRRVQGEEHPATLSSMGNLAAVQSMRDRNKDSETLLRQLLEIQRRVQGEEHPYTLSSMNNLAIVITKQGRYGEAAEIRQQLLELQRKVLGEEHPDTLQNMNSLAIAIGNQGRHAEEEALFRQLLEIRRRKLGQGHPQTLISMFNLAVCISDQRRYEEAETLHRQVLEIRQRVLGERHDRTLESMHGLAFAIVKQGRYEEAEKLFRQVLEIRQSKLGEEHPKTKTSMRDLASFCREWCWKLTTDPDPESRDPQKGLQLARQALELRPDSANNLNNLGVALYRNGQYQPSVDAFVKADSMINGGDREHRMFFAMAYWQLGDQERALAKFSQGAAWIEQKPTKPRERFRTEAEQLMGLSAQDRSELIAKYYTEAETESDDPWFLLGRAVLNEKQGDYEQALADVRRATKLAPTNRRFWEVWNRISLDHYRRRNWQGAELDARLAIQLADDVPYRLFFMAPLLLLAGQEEEYQRLCLDLLNATIEDPAHASALAALDVEACGDPQRVIQMAQRSVEESTTGKAHFFYRLGRAHYRAGDYATAIKWLQKALDLQEAPAEPVISLDMAITHELWGKHDEAREWLNRGIRLLNESQVWTDHGHRRIEIACLRQEAERLILGSDTPNSKPTATQVEEANPGG